MRDIFLPHAQPQRALEPDQIFSIDIQYATQNKTLPNAMQLRHWICFCLKNYLTHSTISLRIVDAEEMMTLNRQYRGKNKPTNVLSFPLSPNSENILGDIVICAPVVLAEAEQQNKNWQAHWAHLIIHGCLHLLGFDHITEADAQVMEPIEVELLAGLGFPNPYIQNT